MSNNQTIEMPKTYRERLEELEVGDSILIDNEVATARYIWGNYISASQRETEKQFTIRTDRKTKEMRIWRLK